MEQGNIHNDILENSVLPILYQQFEDSFLFQNNNTSVQMVLPHQTQQIISICISLCAQRHCHAGTEEDPP